jgi:hypothetical protein
MKIRAIAIIATACAVLFAACGSSVNEKGEFNESAVKHAVETSGIYDNDATGAAAAVDSFHNICKAPDISINDYTSVYWVLTNDEPSDKFVATAKLGCPDKFARVQRKLDNGDCFGGPLAGCK